MSIQKAIIIIKLELKPRVGPTLQMEIWAYHSIHTVYQVCRQNSLAHPKGCSIPLG